MDKTVITNNARQTQKLGEELAMNLGANFLALFGDFGSGKTTFAQGFARGLRIKERVISPTFVIVREHILKDQTFYHIDLYRVQTADDIEGLGLEEIFNDSDNIIVVEWAEKIKDSLPKKRMEIYFEHLKENQRKITFKNYE